MNRVCASGLGSWGPDGVINERVEGLTWGSQRAGAGIWHLTPKAKHKNSEVGKWDVCRWVGVAGTCCGGKQKGEGPAGGFQRVGAGIWYLMARAEREGSEWVQRWVNGVYAGGSELRGPATVVNKRVRVPAWGFQWAGAGIWQLTPKPSTRARNGVFWVCRAKGQHWVMWGGGGRGE